jgi:hypothetical protein
MTQIETLPVTQQFDYDEYPTSCNPGDDAATANRFYTDDIVLESSAFRVEGRDQVGAFLQAGHEGIREQLVPLAYAAQGDVLLAELDLVLDAEVGGPSPVGVLPPGRTVTRCFASYRVDGDRISSLRLGFWPVA